jgi:hypothetical protein
VQCLLHDMAHVRLGHLSKASPLVSWANRDRHLDEGKLDDEVDRGARERQAGHGEQEAEA